MIFGVIDIGSNSVRLMLNDGINTLKKLVKITRLAENMGEECVLKDEPIKRTVKAVTELVNIAKQENAEDIFIFATCAVRQSKNSMIFTDMIYKSTNIKVDIVSGENEAFLGVRGALNGRDGGVIDIGGGSTEITVIRDGRVVFSKSINIGVVKIKDFCGHDKDKATEFISDKIKEFGYIPYADFVGIGGTCTTVASLLLELVPYDPAKVDGYKLNKQTLIDLSDKLFDKSLNDIYEMKGIQRERVPVISGGVLLLKMLFDKIKIDEITMSERDNLEGYLMTKREQYEKIN